MGEYLERASFSWSENSIRLIETASQKAKNFYLYIQEAGYFETRYPYFTERQNLNSFLLVSTISGKGYLTYEGNEYELTKGSTFLINCMNYHYYESAEDDPWEILWIHFNGYTAMNYYEELTKEQFQILQVEESFFIHSNLRRMISLHQRKDINRELITSNLITSILTELILLSTPTEYLNHYIPSYIKELKYKLNQDYKEPISLDSLSKQFNISKYHLGREFKKHTGITINEYIIDRRMNHGKELLKYSDRSISEISDACGIPNVSHFIYLFKEREGTTPLKFRKEWRV